MDEVSLLAVRHLSKSFPDLRALDDVSFDLAGGEILAVVGQNGSGKSTLVKTLAGVHEPDPGASVMVRGRELVQGSGTLEPGGLHFIHQDLGLVAMLSTIENLDLTRVQGRGRDFLPFRKRDERSRARTLISRYSAEFDVEVPIAQLSPEQRTIVAIARAMDGWRRPDEVLVLDEPTAALEGEEVERLFTAVRRAAEHGAGVIFISHRLDEVMNLAHRVLALRDGRVVADVSTSEVDHSALVRAIAGREVTIHQRVKGRQGLPVLSARGVSGGTVKSADLTLREGEIVGLYGLLGSGREHLGGLLFGAVPRSSGEIDVAGRRVDIHEPKDAIARSVAFVPSDRHRDGAVMDMSMRENLTLPMLSPLVTRAGALRSGAERAEARTWAERIELQPSNPDRQLQLFSGGNQQKVVLAMRLRTEPVVLLLDEPTQGVDVAAKAALYKLIDSATEQGASVMVSSADARELTLICDRVLVMRDGYVAAELDREHLTEEALVAGSLGLT
ncbi:MAG TPA: sugar ABC transporter ATP-binding protein [Solirubrobacteraceae bacterium]|nr:sugar ABC transporter ATP-binding protein [Solirubrobacteraceae bacterium]